MVAAVPPLLTARGITPEMLVTAIRDAKIEPCVLSASPATSRLARLPCPGVCLDFASVGPALRITGEMPAKAYSLLFVDVCPRPGRSLNFAIEHLDGYIGLFAPGGSVDALTPAGYATASLSVPEALFHEALAAHSLDLPVHVLRSGIGLPIEPTEQARLRRLLHEIERALWDDPAVFQEMPARHAVEAELIAAFLGAIRCSWPTMRPHATRTGGRLRRLGQACDFLAAHAREPIQLSDLCTELGLTGRGVEQLFRDLLGLSPIAYLRHLRLHGARQALRNTPPSSGSVKRIALEWGFWHLGRFASQYRMLFGESPSTTIARPAG